MRLMADMVDVLLFKAVQVKGADHATLGFMALHAFAVEHGERRGHRPVKRPGSPEHLAVFAGYQHRLRRLTLQLVLEPGVLVVNLVAQHAQTAKCRNDPLGQTVARQFAQQHGNTSRPQPRNHDGKYCPQHVLTPDNKNCLAQLMTLRRDAPERWAPWIAGNKTGPLRRPASKN